MEAAEYKEVFKEYPEPKAKKFWIRDFHDMIVHTRGGHSEKLIGTRRPNEQQSTFDYRIANDQAITRNSFIDAITNLQQIMSQSSVEVRFPEKIKPFLNAENFDGTDFISFIQRRLIKSMIECANARLVWWPFNVGDTSKQVEMRPIVVYPNQVLHSSPEVFAFLSEEKSPITHYNKTQYIGEVYYIILEDELWKRVQTGKKGDDEWEWSIYYTNPIGKVYALPLGGDETSDNIEDEEVKYLTSYMSSAVPFANECKVQFSDHQGVMVNCSSPIREIEPIDCINPECKDGKIFQAKSKYFPCGTCNGTGTMPMPSSPYGVIVRAKRQKGVTDRDTTDIPVMRFIHPDPSILEFGEKSWRALLEDTQDALKLLFTDVSQSGVAKTIDREDKLAWLDKVAVNVYNYLVQNSVKIIYKFMYPGEAYPDVTIILPPTFVVKTPESMTDEITKLKATGMPEFMVIDAMREYEYKRSGGDQVRMKRFDVLMFIDPLFIKQFSEKLNMLNAGMVTDSQLQFSVNAPVVLSNYQRETADFMDMTVEEIAKAIIPLIEAKIVLTEDIKPRADFP